MNVLFFKRKLRKLFSLHPEIKKNDDLARVLGVGKSAITMWGGDDDSVAEIPDDKFHEIRHVFFLAPEVLLAKDMTSFEAYLRDNPLMASSWSVRAATATNTAEVEGTTVRIELECEQIAANERGILDPDVSHAMLKPGHRVRVKLTGPDDWHVVIIERNPIEWTIRRPSLLRRSPKIENGHYYFPEEGFSKLDSAIGDHRVVGVLVRNGLPETAVTSLLNPESRTIALNMLPRTLATMSAHCVVGVDYRVT